MKKIEIESHKATATFLMLDSILTHGLTKEDILIVRELRDYFGEVWKENNTSPFAKILHEQIVKRP